MTACQELTELCQKALISKNINDKQHQKRLRWEIRDLEIKEDCEYFIKIYEKGIKNLPNKKNILIPYLLEICTEFDIKKEPSFITGDFPDIDSDYSPEIQQYLKNEWIPNTFGQEYVCNVGSHNMLGVKMALIDTVRIYDKDRSEILKITKNLPTQNDEGKPLTFDEAILISPNLKKYLEDNPDIDQAARKLTSKIRSMGQHASGIIISNTPLTKLVPLVSGKEGKPCSAWGEGQHSLDLSTVGLIKFDTLGSESVNKIRNCVELIKKRHGIEKICALSGGDNWSDISYLNDPKCLEAASNGDLKTVFQFDSDTVRNMCKKGGVGSFDDLVAYTSLNRPGCLEMKTDQLYIRRKNGEPYEIHPKIEPILGRTYGILGYQEQCVQLLNKIGKIPEYQCMEVQKAISKKKVDKFIKYKEIFIKNSMETLNESEKEVTRIWEEIEAMAGYSFNKCLSGNTKIVDAKTGKTTTIKKLHDKPTEFYINSMNSEHKIEPKKVLNIFDNGKKDVLKLITWSDASISTTSNHKFYTLEGWKEQSELRVGNKIATYMTDNRIFWDTIKSIKFDSNEQTYDLEVEDNHNYVANNIIVHNSHAVSYTYVSSRMLWLKCHYPIEWYASVMSSLKTADKRIQEYRYDAIKHGIKFYKADINKSKLMFHIENNGIYFSMAKIKGIGDDTVDKIAALQPFSNFKDFLDRFGFLESVIKPVLAMRLFKEDTPLNLYKYYRNYKDELALEDDKADKAKEYEILFNQILPVEFHNIANINDFSSIESLIDKKLYKKLLGIKTRLDKSNFNRNFKIQKLTDRTIKIEPELLKLLEDEIAAELDLLGSEWDNPLLAVGAPIDEQNFEWFEANEWTVAPVNCKILTIEEKQGKVIFYKMIVSDVLNNIKTINVWKNTYEKWKDMLIPGKMIRIRLNQPTGGFPSYSVEEVRYKKYIRGENDFRIVDLEKNVV